MKNYKTVSITLIQKVKSIHETALKSQHPELFLESDDGARQAKTSFGTSFPLIAVKGDVFVRVDQMPNRVYKFEGKSWIEIDKSTTDIIYL